MKSSFNRDSHLAIPDYEIIACSFLRRNHDITLGSMLEMFFCMEFIGHYVCRPEFHIRRSIGQSALLLLTTSGMGRLVYRGCEYTLTRGSCLLIDMANQHEYHTVGDHWEFKYLHFHGAMSDQYVSYIEEHSKPVFTLTSNEFLQMERTLDRIFDMTGEAVINAYADISSLIYSLIMLLFPTTAARAASNRTGATPCPRPFPIFARTTCTISAQAISPTPSTFRARTCRKPSRVPTESRRTNI